MPPSSCAKAGIEAVDAVATATAVASFLKLNLIDLCMKFPFECFIIKIRN
jgi:hypothetical protein